MDDDDRTTPGLRRSISDTAAIIPSSNTAPSEIHRSESSIPAWKQGRQVPREEEIHQTSQSQPSQQQQPSQQPQQPQRTPQSQYGSEFDEAEREDGVPKRWYYKDPQGMCRHMLMIPCKCNSTC